MSSQQPSERDTTESSQALARIDALEQQLVQIINVLANNTNAIITLVNTLNQSRTSVDSRLGGVESQLVALNRSHQLLAAFIASRLSPSPNNEEQ